MKWEYRVARCNLGWNVAKRKEKDGFGLLFLGANNRWILENKYAKIFYTEEDAKDALVHMKVKDAKNAD